MFSPKASGGIKKQYPRFNSHLRQKSNRDNAFAATKTFQEDHNTDEIDLIMLPPFDVDKALLTKTMTRQPTPSRTNNKLPENTTYSLLPDINNSKQQLPPHLAAPTPPPADPQHLLNYAPDHISQRIAPEIKRLFQEHNLELRVLF